jgi:hypothetical protein
LEIIVLEKVFARLNAANITLGAVKCHLAQPSVHFLGHVVSAAGILPNPTKVAAIEALALSNDKAGLDTALGIMGYCRKLIYGYASIAVPLRAKASAPPHTCRKGADGIVLTSDSILKHPNWDHPFALHTDASHKGLGAVLCQRINGNEQVFAYASRAISKSEAPWSTWELEALAIVWATRLFRMYLYNTRFRVFTDSRAAKALFEANDAKAGGRLLRWRLALAEFAVE